MSGKSRDRRSSDRWVPIVVGVFATLFGMYVCISLLRPADWDPSIFVKFPAAIDAEIAYGESMLGEITPAAGYGHDGKYFFMQAMDPFYLSPDEHAAHLDRPRYRAQRMVYPTIASGFGLLPAEATAWSLLITNLAALGIGTWLTAQLAKEIGISPWFGLAFLFNPGVLVATFIDTSEVLALLFMLAGALYVLRQRTAPAVTFLTLAALSRETMILATIGAIVFIWRRDKVVPKAYAIPFIASAAWWLYLRVRLGHLDSGIQDVQALGAPFKGFLDAFDLWLNDPGGELGMAFGVILLAVSLLLAWRAISDGNLLYLMTAGFVLVAVLMAGGVWRFYFDATRALVPVITVYVLAVMSSIKASRDKSTGSSDPNSLVVTTPP